MCNRAPQSGDAWSFRKPRVLISTSPDLSKCFDFDPALMLNLTDDTAIFYTPAGDQEAVLLVVYLQNAGHTAADAQW